MSTILAMAVAVGALAATPPMTLTGASGTNYAFCQSGNQVPGTEQFVNATLGLILDGGCTASVLVTGPQGTSESIVQIGIRKRPWAWRLDMACDYSALANPGGWCLARGDVGTTIHFNVSSNASIDASWSLNAAGIAGASVTLRKAGSFVNVIGPQVNSTGQPVAAAGSSVVSLSSGDWNLFVFGGGQGMTTGAPGTQVGSYSAELELTFGTKGDTNGDGAVNGADLAVVLAQWGACIAPVPGSGQAETCDGDLNWDGLVDGQDLGLLLAAWTG